MAKNLGLTIGLSFGAALFLLIGVAGKIKLNWDSKKIIICLFITIIFSVFAGLAGAGILPSDESGYDGSGSGGGKANNIEEFNQKQEDIHNEKDCRDDISNPDANGFYGTNEMGNCRLVRCNNGYIKTSDDRCILEADASSIENVDCQFYDKPVTINPNNKEDPNCRIIFQKPYTGSGTGLSCAEYVSNYKSGISQTGLMQNLTYTDSYPDPANEGINVGAIYLPNNGSVPDISQCVPESGDESVMANYIRDNF
jgi:hypothetical protein